jgi:hypothetical protein
MSNIEILESFQPKALRMIMDAPWYVPNTIIRKDLQIPMAKHEISRYSYHLQQKPQRAPKLTNFKPSGTTGNNAIAKELAKRSAYQI